LPVKKSTEEGAAKAAPKTKKVTTKAKAARPKAKASKATAARGKKTSSRKAPAEPEYVRVPKDQLPARGTGKSLLIVESPAKAKTLQKYLGKDFKIEASVGHVKDLPPSKFGVDIEHGFSPEYQIMKGKEKVIDRIRHSAAGAPKIYLAPDPDREGEAIAWHIASELEDLDVSDRLYRATFNEITRKAVTDAIAHPRELNKTLFEAQQTRRILDRVVGYKISPLLWTKVTRGLSAGRVQSVAVRLVVEREREIEAFHPQEYWSVEADVAASQPPPFKMRLTSFDGKKPDISAIDGATEVLKRLAATNIKETELAEADDQTNGESKPGAKPQRRQLTGVPGNRQWEISSVEKKDVKRHPAPPFITSTLQQEASRKLGYAAKRTMSLAQKLYEGLQLGEMGHTALITYMRTDSTRISNEAITAVRELIGKRYGQDYLPEKPNFYRSKKDAQDAHECVRPTDMALSPDFVAQFLERDYLRLYTIIWNRFVASQMADAQFEQTRLESKPESSLVFTATGLVQKFPGYLAVYEEGRDEKSDSDETAGKLPAVAVGDKVDASLISALQHFTQPPPRYTEATLVKELESRGIGRPSTYASIVSVIQDKDYVGKEDGKRFRPTELGNIVTDLLVENFPEVLDVGFTAQMEEKLDAVEEGSENWQNLLEQFYVGFKDRLDAATKNMRSVKQEEIPTDILCEKCGQANMVIKFGRNGRFLACPRYPECKNTGEYTTSETGQITAVKVEETNEICPNCGKNLIIKNGRHGRFLACPGYPECKTSLPLKTGVKCPECKTGDLVEKVSKKGKVFYSCSNYPECAHAEWNQPIPEPCPKCNNPYLSIKEGKNRAIVCPNKECDYTRPINDDSQEDELAG